MSMTYPSEFDNIVAKAKADGRKMRVAIAGADVENILKGVFEAEADGFVEPILVGNYKRIQKMIDRLGFSDREFDIQPIDDASNVVQYAIEMIKAGSADALMRGNTGTRDFLLPVLNKSNRLIKDDMLVTHVVFLKIPGYEKLIAISDVTLLINPTADGRKEVVKNMVRALNVFDVQHPNIALLALVEKPSFQMRDTVEDQTMVKEHGYRPIADCNLVGPIAYDLIFSKEAARLKNFDCEYCGEFDGIVVPNLSTGNVMIKVLQHNAGAVGCGVLVGARIPIAIVSRADSPDQAYLSLATITAMWKDPEKRYWPDYVK